MSREFMGLQWSAMLPYCVRYALKYGGTVGKSELQTMLGTQYEPIALALAIKAFAADPHEQDTTVLNFFQASSRLRA